MDDLELVLRMCGHIINPCEDLQGNNIRLFYIDELEKQLPLIQDDYAKEHALQVINIYRFGRW